MGTVGFWHVLTQNHLNEFNKYGDDPGTLSTILVFYPELWKKKKQNQHPGIVTLNSKITIPTPILRIPLRGWMNTIRRSPFKMGVHFHFGMFHLKRAILGIPGYGSKPVCPRSTHSYSWLMDVYSSPKWQSYRCWPIPKWDKIGNMCDNFKWHVEQNGILWENLNGLWNIVEVLGRGHIWNSHMEDSGGLRGRIIQTPWNILRVKRKMGPVTCSFLLSQSIPSWKITWKWFKSCVFSWWIVVSYRFYWIVNHEMANLQFWNQTYDGGWFGTFLFSIYWE